LTRSRRRRKLSFNRKRSSSIAKGEGSPQGSPERAVCEFQTDRGEVDGPPPQTLASRGKRRRLSRRQGRKVPGCLTGGRAAQGMTPGSTEAQADRLPGVPPRFGVDRVFPACDNAPPAVRRTLTAGIARLSGGSLSFAGRYSEPLVISARLEGRPDPDP
jgi:hypothetical protein